MNKRLRDFERESGLDIYGLGARRDKWERALAKYAELIVKECISTLDRDDGATHHNELLLEYFEVTRELPVCKHDWYSAKNPVVQNGSVCVICGAIDPREPEELKNEQ